MIRLVLLFSALFIAFQTSAIAASVYGSSIPSVSSVTDSSGNVWTVSGGYTYKNGVKDTAHYNMTILIYINGNIYEKNQTTWYEYNGSGWGSAVSDPRIESLNGGSVPTLSGVVDASLNVWALSGGYTYKNGVKDTTQSGIGIVLLLNGAMYEKNSSTWFAYKNPGWTQLSADPKVESVTGANIPKESYLVDHDSPLFNVWIISGGKVYENGALVGTTSNISSLYFYANNFYAKNTSGSFTEWNGTAWASSSDPFTASVNEANVPALAQLIDSSENVWTLSGAKVYENGALVGTTSNISELILYSGKLYAKNTSGAYTYWTGSTWASTTNPTPHLSAGCGKTGQPTGSGSNGEGIPLTTTDGNNTKRSYYAFVPTNYNPNIPVALTLVYHGDNAKYTNSEAFDIQNAPGAEAAGIFLFPQGIAYENYGIGWDDTCTGRDMPLFDNMTAYIEDNYCVDMAHVYAAGFSWGGDHVTALSCCRGTKLAGISTASTTDEYTNSSNYLTYDDLPCPNPAALPIRYTHTALGDGGYTPADYASTSELYRSFDSCSSSSNPVSPSPCVQYTGCTKPVVECVNSGTTHAIPANWGTDTWEFLTNPN